MSCLILGNHTQGLGIIRSLFEDSKDINLLNDKIVSISRFSKYLNRYFFIKRNTLSQLYKKENTNLLLQHINKTKLENKTVLYWTNEDTAHFLYSNKAQLTQKILFPDNDIDPIIDKFRFAIEVKKQGFLTPDTHLLADVKDIKPRQNTYVCKGRTGNKFKNVLRNKGLEIKTWEDISRIKKKLKGKINENEVILQQKIKKNETILSCCGFSLKGEVLRCFQYVKLRQHPNEFGTGTFLQSIKNEDIFAQTVSLIKHFSYTGIYEIEYIKDNDACYYIIEMNPRTWKSIHFATDCGQNICRAYFNYMKNGVIPKKRLSYTTGRYWVDLGTDIPMLIKNWKSINIDDYGKKTFYCVLNRKDPLPFIAEIFFSPLIALEI